MIRISKETALRLNKEFGVPYKENGISHTTTKHKTYWLCESEYNLTSLLKIDQNDEAEKILGEINKKKNRRKFNNEQTG